MADPKRLVERLGPGFERELLELGAREAPEAGARERVEMRVLEAAALASVAAAGASAAGAGGASAKAASGLALGLAKWLGAGLVIGGASAWLGAELVRREPRERPAPSAVAVTRPAPPAAPLRADEAPAPTRAPEVTIEGRVPPPAASPSQGDVRIGAPATLLEAESMRRIRAEARNDRARALRLLDEHLMRFPSGESAGEARRLKGELERRAR